MSYKIIAAEQSSMPYGILGCTMLKLEEGVSWDYSDYAFFAGKDIKTHCYKDGVVIGFIRFYKDKKLEDLLQPLYDALCAYCNEKAQMKKYVIQNKSILYLWDCTAIEEVDIEFYACGYSVEGRHAFIELVKGCNLMTSCYVSNFKVHKVRLVCFDRANNEQELKPFSGEQMIEQLFNRIIVFVHSVLTSGITQRDDRLGKYYKLIGFIEENTTDPSLQDYIKKIVRELTAAQ